MKEVVDKLREFMRIYNLNQREVAKRFGVHESTVSRWLSGDEMKTKHMNLIKFMVSGHESPTFTCSITGREQCPFDGASRTHRAILELVLDMDERQCLDVLQVLVDQKKGNTTQRAAKAGA